MLELQFRMTHGHAARELVDVLADAISILTKAIPTLFP
jgi:hypothetical protein